MIVDGVDQVDGGSSTSREHDEEAGCCRGVVHRRVCSLGAPRALDGWWRAEGYGLASGIDGDHGHGGRGDVDDLAGAVAFGLDIDADGDALGALARCAGVEVDDVADLDGGVEVDALDGGGDPSVGPVASGLDESGLVDRAEDDAAEDGAVVVRVHRAGHDAERKLSLGVLG